MTAAYANNFKGNMFLSQHLFPFVIITEENLGRESIWSAKTLSDAL
jgi:hypothetical protein